MRVVFKIDVGIDVGSYVQAGEVLDRIERELKAAIGPKGEYDIAEFRSRHRPVREVPMEIGGYAEQAMAKSPG